MSKAVYPITLQPDGYEVHVIDDNEVQIPVVHLSLKEWQGEPIANTFGGKGLIDCENEAVFAELAIKRIAEAGGWNARWVETYAMKNKQPYYFSEWGDGPLPTQIQDLIDDVAPIDSLKLIAANNNSSYSGCWDVIMWHGQKVVYVEVKRTKKDRMRITQDRWLESGLKAGLDPDNFIIAWWDFE